MNRERKYPHEVSRISCGYFAVVYFLPAAFVAVVSPQNQRTARQLFTAHQVAKAVVAVHVHHGGNAIHTLRNAVELPVAVLHFPTKSLGFRGGYMLELTT